MANKYVQLALDDGGGKWVEGTVLISFDYVLEMNWGDLAHFMPVKAKISDENRALAAARKICVPLESFMSPESITEYRENKKIKTKAKYDADGKKPKWNKKIDIDVLVQTTPEWQWVVDDENFEG